MVGTVRTLVAATALAVVALSCEPPGPVRATFSSRPLEAGGAYDEPPVPVTTPQPAYPEFARVAQITGTVVLHVLVAESGRVRDVTLIHGVTGLNDAAIEAARRWVFQSAMKDERPVAAWYEISFDFRP